MKAQNNWNVVVNISSLNSPGGMRFLKNGCNGGMENFNWKWEGSQEWRAVGFIMGGMENF